MREAQEQLERVIARMQVIQIAIKASGQPASIRAGRIKGLGQGICPPCG